MCLAELTSLWQLKLSPTTTQMAYIWPLESSWGEISAHYLLLLIVFVRFINSIILLSCCNSEYFTPHVGDWRNVVDRCPRGLKGSVSPLPETALAGIREDRKILMQKEDEIP